MHNVHLRVAISSADIPLGVGLGSRSKHPGRRKRLGTSLSRCEFC